MVQWNESVLLRLREINYTREDFDAAWYSQEDILRFKAERKDIKSLVKRFQSLELFEKTIGDHHSSYGLEKYLDHNRCLQRRDIIRECWDTVLRIQDEQLDNPNIHDVIAKAYGTLSDSNQKEAIARALLYMFRSNLAPEMVDLKNKAAFFAPKMSMSASVAKEHSIEARVGALRRYCADW